MKLQIMQHALAALRCGETVMHGPVEFRGIAGIWIELSDPESARVADCTRRAAPLDALPVLAALDALLATAEIELLPAATLPDPPMRITRRRATFRD